MLIEHLGGHGEAVLLDVPVHDLAQLLLAAAEGDLVVEVCSVVASRPPPQSQILRDVAVEDDAADGRIHDPCGHVPSAAACPATRMGWWMPMRCSLIGEHGLVLVAVDVGLIPRSSSVSSLSSCRRGKSTLRPELVVVELAHAVFKAVEGEVVGAQHHILRRHGDGAAVLRTQEVVGGEHQDTGLGLRLGDRGT